MDLGRLRVALPVVGAVAAVLMPGLAGCAGDTRPCAGQCGPPFQLQVAFRHGTSARAGRAVLRACTFGNPQVERIGRVEHRPLAAGAKPEPVAIVYTRSLGDGGPAGRQLVDCLDSEPAVLGAAYPD